MGRYLNWWKWGYLSSTGSCFDIGTTVRSALERFERSGEPYSGSVEPEAAGNGSLMRLAPVALFYAPNIDEVIEFSAQSSRTTHGAPEAVECCQLLGFVLARCLAGKPKHEALNGSGLALSELKVSELARGQYLNKSRNEVRGSGYAVASLEAALWCFQTTSTFEAAALEAANLGEDADTTAAIVGQVAGAFYGVQGIPAGWLEKLHMREEITKMAEGLYEREAAR
jgi:ADP-ribosyl-[dinitrogen reductase] hydrolase